MTTPTSPTPTVVASPTPKEDNGIGLSDSELSKGRRRLLDLINRLHSTGVQSDMDLPQIAVIGSQSAGKSSLIESISGITLPRAAGTCTRCPTECRLAFSRDGWSCKVTLRFTVDPKGQSLSQVRNEQFGDVIYDKAQVEERIRRAQRAILNPSTSPSVFLNCEDNDLNSRELTFSINCVSLQISGRDVADLSFCDLPGLIASVGKGGNENDIKMVQSLVTSYISKPSCVILSVVACETDYENQGAHQLAKKYDPEGKRTIGVLTKPDRMSTGDEDRWLRFIRNEAEPLLHGWYCVKQPNSKSLSQGISWKEARSEENDYFSTNLLFSTLEASYQKYLRTSNLMERLSAVLSDLISKRLPEIHEELRTLIRKAEDDRRRLPKPPSKDPFGEVLHLIGNFTSDLSRHLEGVAEKDGLLQSIRPAQIQFQRAIKATVPKFLPYERTSDSRSLAAPPFLASEGEVDEDGFSITDGPDIIYVDEVYEMAQAARTRELPDNYPFVVQQAYITAIIVQWQEPALNLFDEVDKILRDYVQNIITQTFGHFGRGGLEQMVQLVVTEHLKRCADTTRDKIKWLLDVERRAFTLNTHYYSEYKDKFLSYYRGCRVMEENGPFIQNLEKYTRNKASIKTVSPDFYDAMTRVLGNLPAIGINGVKSEDLARLLPPDPQDTALNIMAGVRGYFQVAYKRFTDMIPLAIDHEFVLGIEREMRQALFEGLEISGADGQQNCKDWAQEPLNISARRGALEIQLDRLTRARQELLNVRF